ncbi:tail protein [Escherichia coli]|nr:tail protein [Escherichia coli]
MTSWPSQPFISRILSCISISLMLTERTLVSEVDGALHVKNIPEPPPPEPVTRPMELYINGELVSKWDE